MARPGRGETLLGGAASGGGAGRSVSITPHCTVGESLMVWAVVTAVLIFIGGMLVVAYAATTADRK